MVSLLACQCYHILIFLFIDSWESGFFDQGSFIETLGNWAQTVVCGRARCVHVCMHACTSLFTYVCVRACVCVCVCACVCILCGADL